MIRINQEVILNKEQAEKLFLVESTTFPLGSKGVVTNVKTRSFRIKWEGEKELEAWYPKEFIKVLELMPYKESKYILNRDVFIGKQMILPAGSIGYKADVLDKNSPIIVEYDDVQLSIPSDKFPGGCFTKEEVVL